MSKGDGSHLLGTLLARRDLVECLQADPRTKPELTDHCGVSRSTVDRGVATLFDAGIVRKGSDGRYELTLFGSIVEREFDHCFERMNRLADVREFLEDLDSETDPDRLPVAADLFEGAEITYTEGIGVEQVLETLAGANSVRLVDPPFTLLILGLASNGGSHQPTSVTVLVRDEVLEEVERFDPELLERFVKNDIRIQQYKGSLSFAFALVERDGDTSLCLILWSDQRGMAIVETATEVAVEWGETRYAEALTAAEPLGKK